MKELLTPKLDYVFKKLFTADMEILIDLLNTVLELPERRQITSVTIKNPQILPEQITEKYIILDILAIDNRQRHYDIEMQSQKFDAYPQRMFYYLSRTYADQLVAGEAYDELLPVFGIHFLDYDMFPRRKAFCFHFELRDVRYPKLRLTDHFGLYLFELPKVDKQKKPARGKEKMYEWLHFLNHAHEEGEDDMQAQYTTDAIQKAFTALERLSKDDEIRSLARMRFEALKFKTIEMAAVEKKALAKGRKEGREEGQKKGMAKGELVGEIRATQRTLKQPISPREDLSQKDFKELDSMLQELVAQLTAKSDTKQG